MDEIIKVNDVSMRFNLAQEKTETLKEYTVKLLTHKLFFNEFYALKHVSFSMKRGESLALIGRNGSGKSTMLKVISGVMYPSGGSVAVNGEIAPMIELGAGFDMELTARENVYLNGAISPLTRTEPLDGYMTPAISLSIVLLPLPLRPMSATDSPGSMEKDTSCKA